MRDILKKEVIIEKTLKHISNAKYIEQFKTDQRYSKLEYEFICGKVEFESIGIGKSKKNFRRKYDIKFYMNVPRISWFLLPFYKLFPIKYRISVSMGDWQNMNSQEVTITKEEFKSLLTAFEENYKRVFIKTLDTSFFDGEVDVFGKKGNTYHDYKKRTPMRDYIMKKKMVKY